MNPSIDSEIEFCLQTDPVDYVESLCENMQLFPKEDILTGDQLLFEYNPEVSELHKSCFLLGKMSLLIEVEDWGCLYIGISFRSRETFHWRYCEERL